jgi:hypothetical protein
MDLKWMARLPRERRHPQLFASLRFAGGMSQLVVTAILLAYDADWWAALFAAFAAANLYAAYRVPRTIRAMGASPDAT